MPRSRRRRRSHSESSDSYDSSHSSDSDRHRSHRSRDRPRSSRSHRHSSRSRRRRSLTSSGTESSPDLSRMLRRGSRQNDSRSDRSTSSRRSASTHRSHRSTRSLVEAPSAVDPLFYRQWLEFQQYQQLQQLQLQEQLREEQQRAQEQQLQQQMSGYLYYQQQQYLMSMQAYLRGGYQMPQSAPAQPLSEQPPSAAGWSIKAPNQLPVSPPPRAFPGIDRSPLSRPQTPPNPIPPHFDSPLSPKPTTPPARVGRFTVEPDGAHAKIPEQRGKLRLPDPQYALDSAGSGERQFLRSEEVPSPPRSVNQFAGFPTTPINLPPPIDAGFSSPPFIRRAPFVSEISPEISSAVQWLDQLGWRVERDADGREFYYHEGRGIASWNIPDDESEDERYLAVGASDPSPSVTSQVINGVSSLAGKISAAFETPPHPVIHGEPLSITERVAESVARVVEDSIALAFNTPKQPNDMYNSPQKQTKKTAISPPPLSPRSAYEDAEEGRLSPRSETFSPSKPSYVPASELRRMGLLPPLNQERKSTVTVTEINSPHKEQHDYFP